MNNRSKIIGVFFSVLLLLGIIGLIKSIITRSFMDFLTTAIYATIIILILNRRKIKFNKIRILYGIIFVLVYWGLICWQIYSMKHHSKPNLIPYVNFWLALPAMIIFGSIGLGLKAIFGTQTWIPYFKMILSVIVYTSYFFFLGVFVEYLVEYLMRKRIKWFKVRKGEYTGNVN